MFKTSHQRLEIIILGPMRGEKKDTSLQIRNAIIKILKEEEAKEILAKNRITEDNIKITYPEQWQSPNIEGDVFFNLDTADLVVVNITPRNGEKNTTPNVFYELGLIHALGLPYILIIEEGNEIPFYMRSTRHFPVKNFQIPSLVKALKEPIYTFIDDKPLYSFTENIISRFYEGLPVVDISATVGLATGYYMNFIRRLLKDGGFISHYPDKIKRLIVIRPISVFNTYEQDMATLKDLLKKQDRALELEKLSPINNDKDGAIWFEHINGIVIEIPRMIYPIKRSPRILSLRKRLDNNKNVYSDNLRSMMLDQAADKLLDMIENIIKFHIRNENEQIRENLLNFTSIQEFPALFEKYQ